MSLRHFPINPHFGRGVYRRLVRLWRGGQHVLVVMDDTHHSMWVLVEHDGVRVMNVQAAIERGPATSCGGSAAGLSALSGMVLDAAPSVVSAALQASANCTHLGDLARLAIDNVHHPDERTEWRIEVPDLGEDARWIAIGRDGATLHRWLVCQDHIQEPAHLAGRPIMKGFLSWARNAFGGEELATAILLQRGVFVARGRRHLVDIAPAVPLKAAAGMADACFSYAQPSLDDATSVIGYVRDFTHGVESFVVPDQLKRQFTEDIFHERD